MNSTIWFMFAVLAIVVVQSRRLDPGPQTFSERIPAIQKPQKRYAMKEVVVYLTPSQIEAIQEGRGFISAQPIDEIETSEENQEETEETQPEQGEDDQLRPDESDSQILEEEDDQVPSSIPVEEPNTEELEEEPQEVSRPPQARKFVPSPEDIYAYLRSYPEPETQTEEAQAEPEESEEESEEIQPEAPRQQRFKLVPLEDSEESEEKIEPTTTEAPQEEPIRERWLRLLEQNRSQLRKSLPAQEKTTTEQPSTEPESTLAKFRFSARYNDQKQAIENEEKLKKNQLQKLKARKPDARANNPSVPVRKEVSVAKQQQRQNKRVKASSPSLVSISEPVEEKVAAPSAKAVKSKKAQAKKSTAPGRAEGGKLSSSPKKPSASVEKTYVVERRVPVDGKQDASSDSSLKPETITIIRHIWEN